MHVLKSGTRLRIRAFKSLQSVRASGHDLCTARSIWPSHLQRDLQEWSRYSVSELHPECYHLRPHSQYLDKLLPVDVCDGSEENLVDCRRATLLKLAAKKN